MKLLKKNEKYKKIKSLRNLRDEMSKDLREAHENL